MNCSICGTQLPEHRKLRYCTNCSAAYSKGYRAGQLHVMKEMVGGLISTVGPRAVRDKVTS